MSRLGAPDEVCDALIERLEQEGYLNEERFARAFVRDKYRFNGWGPLRLQAELRRHRIPSRLIDAAIEELEEEEMQGEDQTSPPSLSVKYRSLPARALSHARSNEPSHTLRPLSRLSL